MLLENALDCLSIQLEDKLNVSTSTMNEPCKEQENVDPNMQKIGGLLRAAQLRKKQVQSKGSKWRRTWLDKLRKWGKHKATKSVVPTKKGAKKQKKNDDVQPQVEVENGGSNKGTNMQLQEYNVIASFTQFLTAPLCANDNLLDQDLF
ncbi:uncharacterized protein LOC112886803 [Panicum hallii]|uniref:uncharacterized protein LOC112886803 n=1 Tax=Panicum hallii TaxID=206008 RepID=UPI000DF4EF41|nr:uncharacterized protein LOC112886803 [Panicum hallii]